MTCELLRPVLLKKPEINTMEKLENELEDLSSKSNTCKMWVDVIIKPTLLLMLQDRSDHEGDFALHLYAAKQMLPLLFAANKHNYARYVSYYLKSMNWLSPEMEQRFLKGEQALRLKDGIYNSIASDMFIECTWMRRGKSRKGYSLIGSTQSPQTVATWVHSQNSITTLTNDLRDMTDRVPTVQSSHKEEAISRMKRDQMDRQNLREALAGCVDPLDPDTHPEGQLMNICNGKVAPPDVNVHEALSVGQKLMNDFESSWPEGFYGKMSMKVTTFAFKRKHLAVEGKPIDPEALYLKAIGLLASDRPLDLNEVISYELGAYPPSYFKEDGSMRLPSAKSELKKCLGVIVNSRHFHPTDIIIDFSAWMWTIKWPKKGQLQHVIEEIKKEIKKLLKDSNVFIFFDRYQDYSRKASTRDSREGHLQSRNLSLRLNMPIPSKENVLRCRHNKKQLNKEVYDSCMNDEEFLEQVTQHNSLLMHYENAVPFQVIEGRKTAKIEYASSHEEADVPVAKCSIICGKNEMSVVKVLADDTDIFALLASFYKSESLKCAMVMESPVEGRDCYDIRATVNKYPETVSKLLPIHALSGCDTVASTYSIGKKTAVAAAYGHSFTKIGKVDSPIEEIVKETTLYQCSLYGCQPCQTSTECRQKQWKAKVGKLGASALKLCSLPPTTQGHVQNTLRAHIQVCEWYSTMEVDPPNLDPIEYGFEPDHINKTLVPSPLPYGVKAVPDYLMKLIKCSCQSDEACKSNRCGCSSKNMSCTMFCACEGAEGCHNPFKKPDEEVEEVDDDDDDDNTYDLFDCRGNEELDMGFD